MHIHIHTHALTKSQVRQLVSLCVVVEFFVVVAKVLHLSLYGATGSGSPALSSLGDVAEVMFEVLIFIFAFVVGVGWAFGDMAYTKTRLMHHVIAVGSGVVLYVACYIGAISSRTIAQPKNYAYHSVWGILVNVIRVGVAVVLPVVIRKRMNMHGEEKRRGYRIVSYGIGGYLLFVAITCAAGNNIDFYQQVIYSTVVVLSANVSVCVVLVWVVWPSNAIRLLSLYTQSHVVASSDEVLNGGRADDGL
eukprot:c11908_g1_i3.p1 GENE.c11908_g1_i3~~c11908_g1_i3.p1  ORF type:complete len:248 (+),score=77.82 c11908_g1_i3:1-744(+)